MNFELEPLPYKEDALEPYISAKTLQYHYGKHHKGYLSKLENAIKDTPAAKKSLRQLITESEDETVYNLAAQVWNHTFYWHCMTPDGGGKPPSSADTALKKFFGSYEEFRSEFSEVANGLFGSGWTWLVKDKHGDLGVLGTGNAENPLSSDLTPILTLDVWEHAYYLDYQNNRGLYVKIFFDHLINWNYVSERIEGKID